MADPKLEYSFGSIPVMDANCASMVAASSEVMFVAVPSMAMTSVKSSREFFSIPSCPAVSAIAASSVVVAGISVDSSCTASDMAANSASVRSVVFATPVMALSNSTEASTQARNSS